MLIPRSVYGDLGISMVPQLGALARSLTLVGDYFLASSYWTLPIELAFYALVFLAMAAGRRDHLLTVARGLVFASAGYHALMQVLTALDAETAALDPGFGLMNMLLLRHGIYFAIGMYFWSIVNRGALRSIDRGLLAVALMAAASEICRIRPHIVPLLLFYGLALCVYLSLKYAGAWVPRRRTGIVLRTLGLITYPLYLLHEVVAGAMFYRAAQAGLPAPACLCLSLFGAILAAGLVVRYAEPQARRLMGACLDRLQTVAVRVAR